MATKDKNLFGGNRGREDTSKPPEKAIDWDAELDELEKNLNEIRATYELYFMGVEKLEPLIARDKIKARVRRLLIIPNNKTSSRFRMQTLNARMIALENYWNRTQRAREAGNYRRDKDKVRRLNEHHERKKARLEQQAATLAGEAFHGEGEPIEDGALRPSQNSAVTEGGARSAAPAGAGTPKARPTARSADDLTEAKLRTLYATYCTAKRRCNEQVDLRFEDMAASLRKQVPKIIKSTGAQEIEFKVVIKSGKAVLKAIPKAD